MGQFFSNPIKRIHHLHPAPHEVAQIAGRQHQLVLMAGAAISMLGAPRVMP
jgi:hypothetical protein